MMKKMFTILLLAALCLSCGACGSEPEAQGTPAGATQAPYADAPAGTAYIGKVGGTPVYEYYFNALFSSYVTEALKNEPGYEEEAGTAEAYAFMTSYLTKTGADGKTNLETLADKTAEDCRRMVTLKLEGNQQGTVLSENKRNSIISQWDSAANEYLAQFQRNNPAVRSRDDALRLLYHMNVNEVKEFSFLQSEVSDYIGTWYTNGILVKNEDLEAYYKAHVNDFRIVNLRAIYLEKNDENGADQKSLAETVARQIKEKPEYMENLARGYNQDETLAVAYGKMPVTNLTPGVPDEVKAWAAAQSEETLFEKNGNVEVVTAENGYYVLLCESFQEYSEEPEDEVYESVGAAYKEEKLIEYVNELEKKEAYAWTEFNGDRVTELAQAWLSAAESA